MHGRRLTQAVGREAAPPPRAAPRAALWPAAAACPQFQFRVFPPLTVFTFVSASAGREAPARQPGDGQAMTVLRMQPASVAAAALVTNGAADERNFLNITSQSAPKPVVVERALSPTPTTATAVPWVPPSTVNKMCADIGPALSEDAVSELLGTAIEPPDGTATRREPAPSRSMQRQRREELERITARINEATDAWDDAIRPPDEWDDGHVPEDAEEIQKEIQLLLAGQRKRGSARADMLEPVADASHMTNQLKQLQQMERESLEEQGESDGGAANVDAAGIVLLSFDGSKAMFEEKLRNLTARLFREKEKAPPPSPRTDS